MAHSSSSSRGRPRAPRRTTPPGRARARSGSETAPRSPRSRRRVELHDRLEHDVELAALHHGADARAPQQAILMRAVGRMHLLDQLVEHAATHDVVEDGVAGHRAAQRGGQALGRSVAHDVAARARAQHLDHGVVVQDARVSEHARVGRGVQDRVHRELAPARKVHVHERDVRLSRRGQLGGLGRARGHADHLEPVPPFECGGCPGRLRHLVVRDQYADRHPCHVHSLTRGETRSQWVTVG